MTVLIPVAKGGEYLEVHPSTLAGHKAAGWTECEPRVEAEVAPEQNEAPAKRGRKAKAD